MVLSPERMSTDWMVREGPAYHDEPHEAAPHEVGTHEGGQEAASAPKISRRPPAEARQVADEVVAELVRLAHKIITIEPTRTTPTTLKLTVSPLQPKSTIEPSFERLEELSRLETDWDGYGGQSPTGKAVASAARLMAAAWDRCTGSDPGQCQPYEIMPITDGGLQLEWRGESQRLNLNVGPDGAISFLHITGRGDARIYREGDDLPFGEALRLVMQVVGA